MIDITGGKGYNGQKVPLCQKDINGSDTEIYHCGDDSGKVHLFSYRTQKLSLLAPKILNWRRFGKIGSCCIQKRNPTIKVGFFLLDSTTIFPMGRGRSCLSCYLIQTTI